MNFKIWSNGRGRQYVNTLRGKLMAYGMREDIDPVDFVFVLGGDGAFLHAVRELKYDSDPIYVGLNAGTLGYLQDVSIEDLDEFLKYLHSNYLIKTNKMSLASIRFYDRNGNCIKDKAVNELQISGLHYQKIRFSLSDRVEFKEEVTSSGIVFATPYGSTAYNKSLGGPVICQDIDVLCATLIAPIQNAKTEDYIQNSLVGKKFSFKLLSDPREVEVLIDGQVIDIDLQNVSHITVEIGHECLAKINYNNSYSKNLKDKMLKK